MGHLWQGRYKSWYIINEDYLYTLFRYVEHNPIKAKLVQTIGAYPFTLLSTQLDDTLDVISCAKHSKLLAELNEEGVLNLLEKTLGKNELEELEREQKKKIIHTEHEFRQEKEKTLDEYFKKSQEREKRNIAILKALEDGYTQASIARHIGISSAAVSKIFRGIK